MNRSRIIARVARIVLEHADDPDDTLRAAIRREFSEPDQPAAMAVLGALAFMHTELGQGAVEQVRARHAAWA